MNPAAPPWIQPGRPHVVLFAGSSLVSRLIRWHSREQWNHAAILFDDLTLYEARAGSGVIRRRWRQNGYPDTGYTVLVPLAMPTEEQVGRMRWFLNDQIGKGYDYRQVARFVTRIPGVSNSSLDSWFCSELVVAALRVGGIMLFRNTYPHEVDPGDLNRTLALTNIYTKIKP